MRRRWRLDLVACATRDVQDKLTSQGAAPFVSTPDPFASLMKAESARYAKVIEGATIRLD